MIKNSLPEHRHGPSIGISEEIHQMKYRSKGEGFTSAMTRVANALKDDEQHFQEFREILYDMRYLLLVGYSPLWVPLVVSRLTIALCQ